MPRRIAIIAVAVCVGFGCANDQAWQFRNGVGLDDAPPPLIIASVHRGAECGFACRPPGDAVYCQRVSVGMQGPPPTGLIEGDRYCFVGTAFDEDGDTLGVGCEVATVGGGPITVTLSASDEPRQEECVPVVTDAGPRDAAIPELDGGLPPDTLRLVVESNGGGGFFIQNTRTGRAWNIRNGVRFTLLVTRGATYDIFPNEAPGYLFDRFEGGGCDTDEPCTVTVDGDTSIEVVYERF